MKIKKYFIFGLIILMGLFLVACGGGAEDGPDDKGGDDITDERKDDDKKDDEKQDDEEQEEINFAPNETNLEVIKSTAKTEYDKLFDEATKLLNEDQKAILEVKYEQVLTKMEEIKGTAEEVKKQLNVYYSQLHTAINLLKETVDTFEKQKEQALAELKIMYDAIAEVANPTTLEYVKSLYDEAVATINELKEESKDKLKETTKAFATAAKEYVATIASEALTIAITYARAELKKLADAAIAKIPNESIKTKVTDLYNTIDLKIAGIIDSEKIDELVEKYINEFSTKLIEILKEEAALTIEQYKELAVERLDRIYNQYKDKLPDETTKEALKGFYDATVEKINACTTDEQVKEIYDNIETTVKEYVKTDLIVTLVNGYKETLKGIVNAQLDKIPYEEVKLSIKELVDTEFAKLDNIKDVNELKEKFEEIKESLPADIAKIVKEHAEGLLADGKAAAIKAINDALTVAIAKVDDAEVKAQLTKAKDEALAAIEKINDAESLETTIEEIKGKFAEEVTKALSVYVKKYIGLAKAEADKVYEMVYAKLSEASQAAIKIIYENYGKALDAIEDVETAINDAEKATKKFLEDIKTYITEALTNFKTTALASIKEKYDEVIAYVDIEIYRNQLIEAFNDASDDINALNDINTFVADVEVIVTNFISEATEIGKAYLAAKASEVLAEAKETAINFINDALTVAIAKIDDEDIKASLTKAKDDALASIAKINNAETCEEELKEIKDSFTEEVSKALAALVKKYVDLAKVEADKVYNLVYAKLSEASQAAFAVIYENYGKALAAINNIETAAKEAEDATTQFLEDSKNYVAEVLTGLKETALATIKAKYDEFIEDVDIETYKNQLIELYGLANEAINLLSDIETFASDAETIVTGFISDAVDTFTSYLTAKAELLKVETLAKGQTLYEAVYEKEEYTSLGIVAKGVAKAKIEAAYLAFKTAVENLTPAVGAKKVCDEAYELLSSTFDKALGIGVE